MVFVLRWRDAGSFIKALEPSARLHSCLLGRFGVFPPAVQRARTADGRKQESPLDEALFCS